MLRRLETCKKITLSLPPISRRKNYQKWLKKAIAQVQTAWEGYRRLPCLRGIIVRFFVSHRRSDLDNLIPPVTNCLCQTVIKDDRLRFLPRMYLDYVRVPKGREKIEIFLFSPFTRCWNTLYLKQIEKCLNLTIPSTKI